MSEIQVGVYKLSTDAVYPFHATELSACHDLHCCFHTDTVKVHGRDAGIPVDEFGTENAHITIFPDEMVLIPTGLIFIIPPTHHLKFYSRSGNVWKKKLVVANQPAVIDADYTMESFVLLHNQSLNKIMISDRDAIAQVEVCKTSKATFNEISNKHDFDQYVAVIREYSSRGGGLGSTDGVGGVINTKI